MFTRRSTWVIRTVQRAYSFTSLDLRLRVSFKKILRARTDRAYIGVGPYSAAAKRIKWMMMTAARL